MQAVVRKLIKSSIDRLSYRRVALLLLGAEFILLLAAGGFLTFFLPANCWLGIYRPDKIDIKRYFYLDGVKRDLSENSGGPWTVSADEEVTLGIRLELNRPCLCQNPQVRAYTYDSKLGSSTESAVLQPGEEDDLTFEGIWIKPSQSAQYRIELELRCTGSSEVIFPYVFTTFNLR